MIISAVSVLLTVSCNKFLDTLPDNRASITNEDQIAKLLASAYPQSTYAMFTNFMSDDYDDIGNGFNVPFEMEVQRMWSWVDDIDEGNDSPKSTWDAFYNAIAHANLALQSIEELERKGESSAKLNALRGEALMCRAWCHFKLVNLFCQHYTEQYGNTDMGIPYAEKPETEVKPHYERGTVAGVYEKIDRDIQEALPLIDDQIYKTPKYHFNRLAAYGFAAEFYLYYRKSDGSNLDKVIEYANVVLRDNPERMMRDVSGLDALPVGEDQYRAYIRTDINANLLLIPNVSMVGVTSAYNWHQRHNHSEYCSSTEGLSSGSALWTTNVPRDAFLLPASYYIISGGPNHSVRWTVPYLFEYTDPVARIGYPHGVMIAVSGDNVVLNRAEAYALKEDYASAMADINRWIRMRFVAGANGAKTEDQLNNYYNNLEYYVSDRPTPKKEMKPEIDWASKKQENFIHAILHMRRIEFWGEGARWFDIKRYGIEITRREVKGMPLPTDNNGKNSQVKVLDNLPVRDLRRAIQIPGGAIAAGMTPNPR